METVDQRLNTKSESELNGLRRQYRIQFIRLQSRIHRIISVPGFDENSPEMNSLGRRFGIYLDLGDKLGVKGDLLGRE